MTLHLRALVLVLALAWWGPAGVVLDAEQLAVRDQVIASAHAHGVDPDRMAALVWCESRFRPWAVGRQGELGSVQLHPYGLLSHFRRAGYTDPFDVWESSEYLAQALAGTWRAEGVGYWHWSCARGLFP